MVTPDGERTMNTFLGAAQDLTPDDIDEKAIADAAIVYLEGYLWDPPQAKEAFVKAAGIAHKAGRRVALTLSDSFCVDRYRAEFLDLIRKGTVDIVFANEHELHSLYETADFAVATHGAAEGCQARGRHPQRQGLRGGDAGPGSRRCRRRRSSRWSTLPAPAICSPPASWWVSRATRIMAQPPASARWPRRK